MKNSEMYIILLSNIETKIMTLVMLKLSKILVVVMIAAVPMAVISTPLILTPSSPSTVQPPVSNVRPLKDNMNQGNKFDHRGEDLEDYGIWDPSPVYGGVGNGAPIPHLYPQDK